jgi:hypothetical protein
MARIGISLNINQAEIREALALIVLLEDAIQQHEVALNSSESEQDAIAVARSEYTEALDDAKRRLACHMIHLPQDVQDARISEYLKALQAAYYRYECLEYNTETGRCEDYIPNEGEDGTEIQRDLEMQYAIVQSKHTYELKNAKRELLDLAGRTF